jgi:hypothetical protein
MTEEIIAEKGEHRRIGATWYHFYISSLYLKEMINYPAGKS